MATGKRYYWIKLKDSFMTSDTVDFMMSQPEGANYVVLYQMLCLKTINTNGRLSRQIGEVLIPYDVEKIQRDCKWFSADTIRVALEMYTKFGLVYRDEDGTLVMADHGNLVGSETDYAEKNRRLRGNQYLLETGHNVSANVSTNVSTDNRYKREDKDIRDKNYEEEDSLPAPDPLVAFAADNLIGMNADLADELTSYRDNLQDDVIRWAINEALANGSRAFSYVRKVLNRCVESGYQTLAEVKAAQEARAKQTAKAEPAKYERPKKPMDARAVTDNDFDKGYYADIMNRPRSRREEG